MRLTHAYLLGDKFSFSGKLVILHWDTDIDFLFGPESDNGEDVMAGVDLICKLSNSFFIVTSLEYLGSVPSSLDGNKESVIPPEPECQI